MFDAKGGDGDGRIAKPGSAEEAAAKEADAGELARTKVGWCTSATQVEPGLTVYCFRRFKL